MDLQTAKVFSAGRKTYIVVSDDSERLLWISEADRTNFVLRGTTDTGFPSDIPGQVLEYCFSRPASPAAHAAAERIFRTTFNMIKQGEFFRLDNSAHANMYVKKDDGGVIGDIWVAIRPNHTVFIEDLSTA